MFSGKTFYGVSITSSGVLQGDNEDVIATAKTGC